MAKKKTENETEEFDSSALVDRVIAGVTKDFGKGLCTSGEDIVANPKKVMSICPSIDIITHGGIQEGVLINIAGKEKTGKTSLALCIAKEAQKIGKKVFYLDAENRLEARNIKGIKGLNIAKPHFNVIRAAKGKIVSAQEYLTIAERILRDVPNVVLIIDSISALADQRELDKGIGTETRGGGAKLVSQFVNLTKDYVFVNDSIVIGINHLMANTSGMGAATIEKGSSRFRYQASYNFRVKQSSPWMAGDKVIGIQTEWQCLATPLGPPLSRMASYFRFGVGADTLYELIEQGISAGFISQAGAWYTLDFLPDKPKVQGAEKVYWLLDEKPKYAEELKKMVFALLGIGQSNEDVEDS